MIGSHDFSKVVIDIIIIIAIRVIAGNLEMTILLKDGNIEIWCTRGQTTQKNKADQ